MEIILAVGAMRRRVRRICVRRKAWLCRGKSRAMGHGIKIRRMAFGNIPVFETLPCEVAVL